ncbi:MAG: TRAP transporter small permease [Pseudomonadota bacterium]
MHKAFWLVAKFMAVLGGLVLTGLVLMTCVSILGRQLNGFFKGDLAQGLFPDFADNMIALGVAPILGDVELVEAGMAFTIFAFLPLCQISGAHAQVDIFTSRLPQRGSRVLQLITDLIFAVVLVLIAWRLSVGLQEKQQYSETSFMLQFPLWWAYGASLIAASVAALVGIYVVFVRGMELLSGRDLLRERNG